MLEASEGKLRPVSVVGVCFQGMAVDLYFIRSVALPQILAISQDPVEAPPLTREEVSRLSENLDHPSQGLPRVEQVNIVRDGSMGMPLRGRTRMLLCPEWKGVAMGRRSNVNV